MQNHGRVAVYEAEARPPCLQNTSGYGETAGDTNGSAFAYRSYRPCTAATQTTMAPPVRPPVHPSAATCAGTVPIEQTKTNTIIVAGPIFYFLFSIYSPVVIDLL